MLYLKVIGDENEIDFVIVMLMKLAMIELLFVPALVLEQENQV